MWSVGSALLALGIGFSFIGLMAGFNSGWRKGLVPRAIGMLLMLLGAMFAHSHIQAVWRSVMAILFMALSAIEFIMARSRNAHLADFTLCGLAFGAAANSLITMIIVS